MRIHRAMVGRRIFVPPLCCWCARDEDRELLMRLAIFWGNRPWEAATHTGRAEEWQPTHSRASGSSAYRPVSLRQRRNAGAGAQQPAQGSASPETQSTIRLFKIRSCKRAVDSRSHALLTTLELERGPMPDSEGSQPGERAPRLAWAPSAAPPARALRARPTSASS